MKANCANILQEQKFQDMVTKFETYLKESLQKQREKELKSAEEQAFNELKQYSKENMSENDKKYFLERYIKFSNKSIKGVITNVTVNEKCIPLIENYLSNGGTLYETKSSSKAPFDYDIWVPSQMPENLIQCDIRPVPCLPGAIQTEFKPPELVKKTFAPPTIGSVAVQFNVPKIQPKPTQVKQEAPKPVQVKQEVQTQQIQPKPAQVQPKPTQETPKPVQSQEKSNGPSELQIILVFNAIKNTQLNKLVLNGNLSGFKQEIKKIEQQLSIIDMFSSQEYLNSTQANDKDFLLIKEIYENHSQIEEIIPRYEKFQRFSNGIYFIQSDKDLIQKIISNPEDIQTSIYSLERMKTNVTNLMKFNDKFDDLKYCPTEQLEKILECQKIATILNDKIDDIITHEKQKEVASRVKASYNTQLRYYQEEIDSQNYERKIRYYEDLLKAKDEIYNKYKEYVNVNPLKQFLDDIETLIKKTKDEKIIENAKIKTESEKFLIRYRPLIERLQREQSPSQSLNNDLSQLEESFRRQNPSIFEVEEVKDLIQKKEQIQEKQNGYKMQQQINAEAFQTSKQLNEIIPKEFENWEIEKFNELLEKRKHIIIEGKEVDTTQTPKVQEILDNFKEKQQQCYLLKLIQYYEITHPDRTLM
ncbi:hypothetical protein GPJ56_010404 [Histomonas meleagridis]|uniref:uncharacterized protein n=1 Tax=Histomonas meleagridis TaxID=135588 RepID=UPI00355A1AB7|nr:hypothetical protein GPJ56_010404 [Histomonas meleagridis]KAH0799037.1 hypothetical protein GO595_008189 [Histomonas meleagridis]